MDFDIWYIIAKRYKIPIIIKENEVLVKEKKNWDENEKKNFTTNAKVMNTLFCVLDRNEFNRVFICKTAQSIWRTLEVTHESTNKVKDTKLNMFKHKYELFMIKPSESINEMYTHFTNIISGMISLGKSFNNKTLAKKTLRILSKSWAPKVTVIQEVKDLSKVSIEELLRSLMTYETTQKK